MRRRPLLVALAPIVLALAPASASAGAWLDPIPLTGTAGTAPAVATGVGGDAAAVWTAENRVEARVRAPGGGFGDIQVLSAAGSAPDVALGGDGTGVATWVEGETVKVALRPPGGAFGPAQDLPPDGGGGAPSDLRVVMNDAGEALLTYVRGGPVASSRPAGGNFATPASLSGNGCNARAALGPAGHAVVTWQGTCVATEIRAARRGPGEAFGQAIGISGESGTSPAVAIDGDGTTTVVYERSDAIRAVTAAAGAPFGSPVTVSGEDAAAAPAVAAGGGETWAVWRSGANATARIAAARRPAGGAFAAAPAVSADGVAAAAPVLQSSASGGMVAAWLRQIEGDVRAEAAHRAPGAPAFGAPAAISAAPPSATVTDLSSDGDGNAAAGYLLGNLPVARVFDGGGPRLLGIDFRASGFAKEPYPFAVAPADVWSGVAGSAFDFGDGTTAAGPSATHAFPEPAGARTVTVSATDTVGNVSRAQRTFSVAPALDRIPPVISNLRLDAKRLRVSNKQTAISAATRRRGTRFRYTISEPSVVSIYFERLVNGRLKGKRCVRGRTKGKRCTVYEPVVAMTRAHPLAGPVSVGFTGRVTATIGPLRVSDTTFLPGRYRATIIAVDALSNISKPAAVSFTIVSG